ncbi:hypothetical protein DFJ74DRAFT_327001 [Hyaloraphidium curvatum]|nr:hypothetical protein DFJ74DRAFT_327001 [Hyaloraphidium curvatum]
MHRPRSRRVSGRPGCCHHHHHRHESRPALDVEHLPASVDALLERHREPPRDRKSGEYRIEAAHGTFAIRGAAVPHHRVPDVLVRLRAEKMVSTVVVDALVSDEGLADVVDALRHSRNVAALEIKVSKIGARTARALSELLSTSSSLQSIALEWNSLGADTVAVRILADGLASSASLRALDLRNNLLGDDSIHILSEGLKRNKGIRTIDLRWNRLTSHGASVLLHLLYHSTSIQNLELAGNEVSNELLDSIADQLGQRRREAPRPACREPAEPDLVETFECLRATNRDTMSYLGQQLAKMEQERSGLVLTSLPPPRGISSARDKTAGCGRSEQGCLNKRRSTTRRAWRACRRRLAC